MAKANPVAVAAVKNDALFAMLTAKPVKPSVSLGERVLGVAQKTAIDITRGVGQLSTAVDSNHYYDGKLRGEITATNERAAYIAETQARGGFSDEQMAVLVNRR
jgi:hypothetical protein